MGIYDILLGKGVIIPVKIFVRCFLDEVKEKYEENEDELEVIQEIVNELFGKNYQVIGLGHDAFEGRHGSMFDMFDETEQENPAEKLSKLIQKSKEISNDDLPFTGVGCGDMIFIGFAESITPGDLSYYVKAPEIIYYMTACLPLIIKHYPILLEKDCNVLNEMFGTMSMWTFTRDCTCCG